MELIMDLLASGLFSGLSENELKLVRERFIERVYPKGSIVFVEGQESDGLYIIKKGLVKVCMLSADGREKILDILKDGEMLGEMSLYGNVTRSATVEALNNTTFYVVPIDVFRQLLMEIPQIAVKIIEILSERLRKADRQIHHLIFYNSQNRVLMTLINLAQKYGQAEKNGIKISLKLTHSELAKLTGVSRETVTKVLSDLHEKSIITITQRQLKITDLDRIYAQIT
jgi:CRP/FNR family transcriptional regulator